MRLTRIYEDTIVGWRDDFLLCRANPHLTGAGLKEDPITVAAAGNE
jgi:hypothetical protein